MECIIETKWGSSDLLDKTFTKIVLLGISGGRKIQKKKKKKERKRLRTWLISVINRLTGYLR